MSGLPSTTKFRVRPLNRSKSSPDLHHATSSLVNQTVFRPIGVRRAPGAPPKSVLHNSDTPSKVGPQGIVFFDTQHETPPYLLGIDPNPFPPHTPTPHPTSLDNEDTEFMDVDMMDQMDVDIPLPTLDAQPSPIPSPPPQPSSIPTLASLSRDNPLPDFPYAVSTPKVRRDSRVVLEELRKHKISPAQFFYTIMDRRNAEFERQQVAFYRNDSKFFIPILSLMWICLHSLFLAWLTPKALEICRSKVAKEFEKATPLMTFSKDQVTPEFLSTWNIQNMFSWKTADNTPAAAALDGSDIMPWWHSILEAATTSRDTVRNKKRDGDLTRGVITAQVLHVRSSSSSMLQFMFGIFAWATGASKRMIEVLSHCSLSVSFPTVLDTIGIMADHAISKARIVARGPHMLAYDNINMKTSIFVEQVPGAPEKVQSGTFAIIYELYGVKQASDLLIAPMLSRLKAATDLTLKDIKPSRIQRASYTAQTITTIIKTLFRYVDGFTPTTIDHPDLQYIPRRQLPFEIKKAFYPIRVSTIEEASIEGNILVHDDVYIYQLKRDDVDLPLYGVPTFVDQLSNARIRGTQGEREGDLDAWETRMILQLGIGLFHLIMNLVWCILHKHRLTYDQQGSLSHYFLLLNKKRLAGEKPDYHTLITALHQICDGLILNAWREECAALSHDFVSFAKTSPSPQTLRGMAQNIFLKYATAMDIPLGSVATGTSGPSQPRTPKDDPIHNNTRLLLRDLLYVRELTLAVSSGDFGRVEDILPDVAALFRGGGSNNYCNEILHLLHNFKRVWTPEFADIMRDNFLMSDSGIPDHFMPIDLNTEHLIGYLKQLFAAKGIYSSWDRLGNVSAAIVQLQGTKKHFDDILDTSYKNRTQKDADASALVLAVADTVRDMRLQTYIQFREGYQSCKVAPDLVAEGWEKLESYSLSAFNKKMRAIIEGTEFEVEEDGISGADFSFSRGGEDGEDAEAN